MPRGALAAGRMRRGLGHARQSATLVDSPESSRPSLRLARAGAYLEGCKFVPGSQRSQVRTAGDWFRVASFGRADKWGAAGESQRRVPTAPPVTSYPRSGCLLRMGVSSL